MRCLHCKVMDIDIATVGNVLVLLRFRRGLLPFALGWRSVGWRG